LKQIPSKEPISCLFISLCDFYEPHKTRFFSLLCTTDLGNQKTKQFPWVSCYNIRKKIRLSGITCAEENEINSNQMLPPYRSATIWGGGESKIAKVAKNNR